MKIVIDKILDENIYFSTDYGMAKGIWKGANRPIQKEYYVELDIDAGKRDNLGYQGRKKEK